MLKLLVTLLLIKFIPLLTFTKRFECFNEAYIFRDASSSYFFKNINED